MKPRIFITGGSGLLALNWAATLHDEYDVILALHDKIVAPPFARTVVVDLADQDVMARALDEVKPEIVVHTAGLTNVEACERDPDYARLVNTYMVGNLARQCSRRNIRLIHISTDHLFSDDLEYHNEDAPIAPANAYARTKADGEKAALDANANTLVVRTNFFCWGPTYRFSFSDFVISSLRAATPISLFSDVFFTPILATKLVRAAHVLVEKNAYGIFNLGGDERLSKYEFGRRIAEEFGLEITLINSGLISNRNDLVQRPHQMGLDNSKACHILGKPLGNFACYTQQLATQEHQPLTQELRQL